MEKRPEHGKSPMVQIHIHPPKEPKGERREHGGSKDMLSDMAQQGGPQMPGMPGAGGPEAAIVKMVQQMSAAGMKPEEIMAEMQKLLGGAGGPSQLPQAPSLPQPGGDSRMLDQLAMMGR